MPSCFSIHSHGRRSVMTVKRRLQAKNMVRRTWRCMFCTKDVGVSSVSSPYRVQIVSRHMKKSWYLANSRRYNIHRALRNLKGDEHDQPFLLSAERPERLISFAVLVSFTGNLAGSHGYKNSIWGAFLKKIRRGEILEAPKAGDRWPSKCQVKKQVVLLSKHMQLWRVFSSILTP